jgi:dihydrofolate reductase
MFSLIAAIDKNNGLGKNGQMSWHLPSDLTYFKRITTFAAAGKQNLVIMGRITWESIPEKYRPLPQRRNMIITRNPAFQTPENVLVENNLTHVLNTLPSLISRFNIEHVFVIGGSQLYTQAIEHPECKKIYLTKIHHSFECDAYFPNYKKKFKEIQTTEVKEENGIKFAFSLWERTIS